MRSSAEERLERTKVLVLEAADGIGRGVVVQVKRRSYNDLAGIDLLFFSLLLTPRSLTSFLQALERALNLPGNRVRLQMARTDPPPFRTPFQTGHRRCRKGKSTVWSGRVRGVMSAESLHQAAHRGAFSAHLETLM